MQNLLKRANLAICLGISDVNPLVSFIRHVFYLQIQKRNLAYERLMQGTKDIYFTDSGDW
jgi:hypothetical protein